MAKLASRLRLAWAAVTSDPFRAAVNRQRVGNDCVQLQLVGVLLIGAFHVLKTWRQEGLTDLALSAVPPVLLSQLVVLLARRWPGTVAWLREPAFLLIFLLHNEVNVQTNLRLYRQWEHHGGSALRLLALLLLSSSAMWAAAAYVSVRIVSYLAAPSLVLAALQTLLRTDRLCARILESPGVEEPLTRLNELLFGLHSPVLFPAAPVLGPAALVSPRQQCQLTVGWMTLAVGVLLPLCVLLRLEAREREAAACAAARQAPPHLQLEELRRWREMALPPLSPGNAYLGSALLLALVWVACI